MTKPPPAAADLSPYHLPLAGSSYPHLLRHPGTGWARPMAGALLGLGLFATLTPLFNSLVVLIGWALAGTPGDYPDFSQAARNFEQPIGMLAANLGIAILIPVSAALMLGLHHRHPGWLVSVQGQTRWGHLGISLIVALVVLGSMVALTETIAPPTGTPPNHLVGFLLVIALTSPIQAAAEEVFFRGYLTQALGSLAASPWLGIAASSLVFALLHGTQNLPLFLNRLAFGVVAGILVAVTGGLEAAIAAHIVNNMLAYTIAALSGTVAQLRAISTLSWAQAGIGIGSYTAFAVLIWLIGRGRVATTVPQLPAPS